MDLMLFYDTAGYNRLFAGGIIGNCCRQHIVSFSGFMMLLPAVMSESPEKEGDLYYMVVVISNVLRQNSAVEHQTPGTRIHRLMQKAHPVKTNKQ